MEKTPAETEKLVGRWSFEGKWAGNSSCGKKTDFQMEKTPSESEKSADRWSFEGKWAGNSSCGKKAGFQMEKTPAETEKLAGRWSFLRHEPRKPVSVFWQETERRKSLLAEHGSTDQNCTQDEAKMRIFAVK